MTFKITDRAILLFLLTIAAILRVISCNKYVLMDEIPIFLNIYNFITNHTLMPTHFRYPTFYSYLSEIPTALTALVLYIKGVIPDFSSIIALHYLESVLPYLGARVTSAAFGIATVFLVFKAGVKFFNVKTGLIAAAFLVFSRTHIDYSGSALPDVTMVFFAACSLFFSLSALKSKSVRDFVFAGAFAGFAASTKYNGALMVLLILSVHLICIYDEKHLLSPRAWFNKRIIFSGLVFACAFLIGSPGWVTNPLIFLKALLFERVHMAAGHLGDFGVIYIRHLILFWSSEKTIAVFFGLGLLYAMFRRTRQDIVILVMALLSFVYIAGWQKKSLHYLMFLYPALSLLSARLLSEIFTKINGRAARLSVFLILISVFGWPIYSESMYAYQGVLQDNRRIAERWIHENIPEGSRIAIDWAYVPVLFTKEVKEELVKGKDSKAYFADHPMHIHTYDLTPLEYNPAWLAEVRADFLVTSSLCFDRFFKTPLPPPDNHLYNKAVNRKDTYGALFYDGKKYGWELLREFSTGKGPRILVYRRSETKEMTVL